MKKVYQKLANLKDILADVHSALIAYSGGVDSTFLLKIAQDVLEDRVVAVTASSETYPSYELEAAKDMAKGLGVRHIVVHTRELANRDFANNSPDRCYFCKRELFSKLKNIAKQYNLKFVLDGSNYDDLNDHRPGMRAAQEFEVRSPLQEAMLTKADIRLLSKEMNLPTWDKPSFACLATRIPYGDKITREKLKAIDQAENFLHSLGIKQVRVRHHGTVARIEVFKDDMPLLLREDLTNKIIEKFRNLGYTYVTLDLRGYRTGSMNEILKKKNG
ncbi:MAG TPA: ATP-dependent sacrificial sulfur transferase LarE [bacterium (Candidatus Stahlbacteria)]|nr:ATP-dependent sacrificial sulfur transferase LarE [Candidatus Stahlbacteria bacterium]